MPLGDTAFLALWNDFDPARDAEYNCWHTFEHVPERVSAAGIVAARRYIAADRAERRYFTLYDLASLAALEGPDYADLAQRPTPWSHSMRASFRNFLRRPCETLLTLGAGIAGSIATFRFSVPVPIEKAAWREALQPQLGSSGVSAFHLGRVDATARFPVPNAPEDDAAPGSPHVLLVESIDRPELDVACERIADIVRTTGRSTNVAWESYSLAFAIDRASLPFPTTSRPPPREDLRFRWMA